MNETIKDIVAELRSFGTTPPPRGAWEDLADRLEEAHKRESYNTAQMFEALELASCVIHAAIAAGILKGDDAQNAFFACRAALSAPPRNCDIGTAEEQAERFFDFCDGYHCATGYNGCGTCPLWTSGTIGRHCELKWAQMPYEEGGEKCE